MGGFRRAMPFTFLTFLVGALALSGFPLTSGFFSKDEILAFTINRGGGYWVLAVLGYLAAGLTAFYAFRLVFRVFYGEPVEEARELESGGMAHHAPANPLTGEPEDTDVGFPGPEHHLAERALPMRVAMAPLALLALVAGVLSIPGVTDAIENFLDPSFADSRFHHTVPSDGAQLIGLLVGGLVSIAGIAVAYHLYVRRPGLTRSFQERFAGLHRFLVNKWYFDELFDLLVVRPLAAAGSFAQSVIETRFVQGTIVGGATGVVRVGTSMARAVQTGYLRAYALLLLTGMLGLVLYFLITSS
jgi:NADH-quinone oxidoreductase subunit L